MVYSVYPILGWAYLALVLPACGKASALAIMMKVSIFLDGDCMETLSEVQSLADVLAGRVQKCCVTHMQDNATSGLWRSFMNMYHFTYDPFRHAPQ